MCVLPLSNPAVRGRERHVRQVQNFTLPAPWTVGINDINWAPIHDKPISTYQCPSDTGLAVKDVSDNSVDDTPKIPTSNYLGIFSGSATIWSPTTI